MRSLGGRMRRSEPRGANDGVEYLTDNAAGTFTRVGGAEAFDRRTGLYYLTTPDQTLTTDVSRFYSDGAILIEGARTNSMYQSSDMTNIAWTLLGGASRGASAEVAPDGTAGAADVTFGAASDGIAQFRNALSLNQSGAQSVFARAASAQTVRLEWLRSDGTVDTSPDIAVGSAGWTRLDHIPVNSAAGAGTQQWRLINGSDGAARTVSVWGGSLEGSGSTYASSPIPTVGAAATRTVESLRFLPWSATIKSGVFDFDVWPGWDSGALTDGTLRYCLSANNTDIVYFARVAGVTVVRLNVAGVQRLAVAAVTFSAHQKLTIKVDWPAQLVTLSGFTTGDGDYAIASVTQFSNDPAVVSLFVGCRNSAGVELDGVIGRLRAA